VACACAAAWPVGLVLAQTTTQQPGMQLKNSGPIEIEADTMNGLPGKTVDAAGNVKIKRGDMRLGADQVQVDIPADQVHAQGHVQLDRAGDRFIGTELELNTSDYTGFLLAPTYFLSRTQAGGTAQRMNFLGQNKLSAQQITYSSCTAADGDLLPWELTATRLRADIDANDGLAEGAVLRFYGVPILAAPVLSFPVTDARKSGWLPPQIGGASNAGLEVAVPYYWDIAPNRDMTLTPTYSSRRGPGLQTEYRYLEPTFRGELGTYLLPNDAVAGRDRWALRLDHAQQWQQRWFFDANVLRVSDNAYWTDGLRGLNYSSRVNATPRLLNNSVQLLGQQQLRFAGDDVTQTVYARAVQYQALQGTDSTGFFNAPYRREPQVGANWRNVGGERFDWRFETEVNRFAHEDARYVTGTRLHGRGSIAMPLGNAGWRLTPKLQFTAVTYSLDAGDPTAIGAAGPNSPTVPAADATLTRSSVSRFVPTASLDSQWFLERETTLFGRALTQTLEPRILYVNTPYRRQDTPLFDSAALDLNEISIFSENSFSGVDRIADTHQVTGGLSTRFLDRQSGVELARLGLAQRYLLNDQKITTDGQPLNRSVSDVLMYGTVSTVPNWSFSGIVQYNPETERVSRTIASAVYKPGPYRVLSATYRLQRGTVTNNDPTALAPVTAESVTLGFQWPLWGPVRSPGTFGANPASPAAQAVQAGEGLARPARTGSECRGTFYGVGRVEYSTLTKRMANSLMGVEYDAGCWIGRFIVQRTSTSLNTSTTKWWLQLELIGLSRLGSNPLTTLRDNVPGYQLLYDRNEPSSITAPAAASPSTIVPR
jgi:LPS-assembly protein